MTPKHGSSTWTKWAFWAMVMYPNVGGFSARQQFLKLNDPELMLTCVQIYNDWQTEWASADGASACLPITLDPILGWLTARGERSAPMRPRWDTREFSSLENRSTSVNRYSEIRIGIRCGKSRSISICRSVFHIGSGDMAEGMVEGEDQELREKNGDVCRTRGGYFPAQRRPVERLTDVPECWCDNPRIKVCLSRKRYRLDSLRTRSEWD